MAKKNYEFRPDKIGSGVLSKLFLTRKQRLAILKWLLYAVLLLVVSVLQDVLFSRLRIAGSATDLVPCTILLICILEGAQGSAVFTLFASMFYLFSGGPGYYTIALLTATALCAAIFRQSYLQKGFGTTMLCMAIALLLYELATFAIGLATGMTNLSRLDNFCITVLMTLVTVPVLYPIVMSIGRIGGETWKE